jgi:hypothetical protein
VQAGYLANCVDAVRRRIVSNRTIFIEDTVKSPDWLWKVSTVQTDLDKDKFYKLYVDLMSRPSKKK